MYVRQCRYNLEIICASVFTELSLQTRLLPLTWKHVCTDQTKKELNINDTHALNMSFVGIDLSSLTDAEALANSSEHECMAQPHVDL